MGEAAACLFPPFHVVPGSQNFCQKYQKIFFEFYFIRPG